MRRNKQCLCPALLVRGLALTLHEHAGATNAAYAQLDASGEAVYQMMLRHSTQVLPRRLCQHAMAAKECFVSCSSVESADIPCANPCLAAYLQALRCLPSMVKACVCCRLLVQNSPHS